MPNDSTIVRIEADSASLDAALKRIEQSTKGLASKLGQGFGLLDARIGVLRKNLSELDAQALKSGGLLSQSIEALGSASGLSLLEELGEKLGQLSANSVRLEANFDRLFKLEPGVLLAEFKKLETQLETIGAATEAGIPATGIAGDITVLRAERKQVVDALIGQTSEASRSLGNLIGVDGAIPDTPPARDLARRLEELRSILDQVKAITDDPSIGSQIDTLPFFRSLPGRQRGSLESPFPAAGGGRTQLASSENGFAAVAGETQALREAQDTLSAAVARSNQALSEQASSIGRLDTAARDLGFTFASAFEDAVVEGRRLSDVLEGLEQDILRILTRKLVTEPLAGAVTGLLGGGLGALAGEFHGGGRVGSTPVSGRVVPASFFDGAPRFAGGGLVGRVPRLAPGEVPAILPRGEVVRTPAQEAALRRCENEDGGAVIQPGAIVTVTPDQQKPNIFRALIFLDAPTPGYQAFVMLKMCVYRSALQPSGRDTPI